MNYPAWLSSWCPRKLLDGDRGAGYIPRSVDGRVAQRESTRFTREGSLVQSQSCPPFFVTLECRACRIFFGSETGTAGFDRAMLTISFVTPYQPSKASR